MRRKRASEIFAEVDPHLRVIDGGTHRHHRPIPLTEKEWERARGVTCPRCQRETLRLLNGVCPECAREIEEEWEERKEETTLRNHYRAKMREGTLDLHQMREGSV